VRHRFCNNGPAPRLCHAILQTQSLLADACLADALLAGQEGEAAALLERLGQRAAQGGQFTCAPQGHYGESRELEIPAAARALQNHSGQARCFLDLETGKVIIARDDSDMLPEDDIAHIAIADESGRFREIDGLDSHRGFQIMAEFVETQVTSLSAIRQLQTALGGNSPFRRFKDVLLGYPAMHFVDQCSRI
jgi:Uncharacterised protein family (UPF0158)